MNESQRALITQLVINSLVKNPFFLGTFVLVIVVTAILVNHWLEREASDINLNVEKRMTAVQTAATNKIEEVDAKIEKMFSEPEIRRTVESVARARANEILSGVVKPEVERFQQGLEQWENEISPPKVKMISKHLEKTGREWGYMLTVVVASTDEEKPVSSISFTAKVDNGQIVEANDGHGYQSVSTDHKRIKFWSSPNGPTDLTVRLSLDLAGSTSTTMELTSGSLKEPIHVKVPFN